MSKYLVENNVRIVKPYYTTYKTNVKLRWIGNTLIDIYTHDFNEKMKDIIEDIRNEKLYVLSKKTNSLLKGNELINFKLNDNDIIHYMKHKHEPPIPYGELEIVYQDEELLVVNKPFGVPTHPTGNYYYNSVSEMVKEKLQLENIWVVHRLDKVTSGVLMFGKSKTSGSRFSKILHNHRDECRKVYLARVKGNFPNDASIIAPVISVNMNGYVQGDEIQTGSKTIFKKIKYDEINDESVIQCIPITGKNHQIRIHLKLLDHPIVNDFFYNPKDSNGILKCQIEEKLYRNYYTKFPQSPSSVSISDIIDESIEADLKILKQTKQAQINQKQVKYCTDCHRKIFKDEVENAQVYLHALEFHYKDYHFKTNLPPWY